MDRSTRNGRHSDPDRGGSAQYPESPDRERRTPVADAQRFCTDLVNHGDVPRSFGYRLETPDRTIVISGDAAPSQSIIDGCNGCDVLIHEAYSMLTYNAVSPAYQEYRRKHHTSSREVAEIEESEARPSDPVSPREPRRGRPAKS
jgi:ribonuclease BN (tRNA processing enzyme)